ncbi:hypothetical protein [Agromyces cerinus]|uniref:Uncharacterized protein n=1 Tax=Agromyces cerinus subsp. cerinus TaxID=232089 RepID=A0A1N6HQ02_9MICO|nr:hypothetical protein [Agromyces cerinus]SIO21820.1 hypothetical protein SAMN05443544_3388 [Agromyces cerinus subsp. cerinus]
MTRPGASFESPRYVPNGLLGRLLGRRLNAVVFSMDYVMLWFDGDVGGGDVAGGNVVLNCDVYPVAEHRGQVYAEADLGYGDALRALIPQEVSSTVEQTGAGIVISFQTGRITIRPAFDEWVGPEIATLSGFADGAWMVWRPGEEPFEDLAGA